MENHVQRIRELEERLAIAEEQLASPPRLLRNRRLHESRWKSERAAIVAELDALRSGARRAPAERIAVTPIAGDVENNRWYAYDPRLPTAIVFVHGILSDARTCWTHAAEDGSSVYWPDLILADERFGASIFLGGYYTAVDSGIYEIANAARDLYEALRRVDEAGREPVLSRDNILFVCHSTGGIVLRYMLDHYTSAFAEKNVGVVLIASPSAGSKFANRLGWLIGMYNNRMGRQLRLDNDLLRDLDDRFRTLVHERRIARLSGVEAYENHFIVHRKWWPNRQVIVTKESAGRYFGAPKLLPKTDHFSSCKPSSVRHPAYALLLDFYTHEFLRNAR